MAEGGRRKGGKWRLREDKSEESDKGEGNKRRKLEYGADDGKQRAARWNYMNKEG